MMGDIIRTVAAGGAEKVAAAGDYVHVKTSSHAFHLIFEDENYGKIEVTQGDQVRLKGNISGFRIENKDPVNALNVELIVGFGSFRAGQLVGAIDSINTVVNPVTVIPHDINSIVNPVEEKPISSVLNYFSVNSGANVPVTIVPPAANINGIIVNYLSLACYNSLAAICAKSSPPTSTVDTSMEILLFEINTLWHTASRESRILIPAGLGLYAINDGVNSRFAASYEVL